MRKHTNLKKEYRLLAQVKQHLPAMQRRSDADLSSLTKRFRERLAKGETVDALLPEAFAAICEADWRVLKKKPYEVQILGAITLHRGCLTEMGTGEGKTLVATMPLYLNALTGKSCMLLTTNDYLAARDAEEMGRVYRFMGLSVAVRGPEDPQKPLTSEGKREIYDADIVYTTHGTLGFDYLLNHLVRKKEDRFLREFYYVILDEADSVLLDAAQMPLVISGAPRCQSNLYAMADFFVKTLKEDTDYRLEEGKVWLTEQGSAYAEQYFQIDQLYSRENFEINRNVTLALRARKLVKREEEYLVNDREELVLINNDSGRIMSGVKLRGGLHQALETKEGLPLTREDRSIAGITYQNLFQLFPRMAGMSGTIAESRRELRKVYGTRCAIIPHHRTVHRVDVPDRYFVRAEDQIRAAVEEIAATHAAGRPVLAVVPHIYESEWISELLIERGIPHSVLNANNTAWEAGIIANAGQWGAVTVATAMAGRGTDIVLGPGVADLGGLAVIGVCRMSDSRLERQVRGRAGRQGDPGTSIFFVSLEDAVVARFGPEALERYTEQGDPISPYRLRTIINRSQQLSAEFAEAARKNALAYDKVMKNQRDVIYEMRDRILDGGVPDLDQFLKLARNCIRRFLSYEDAREVSALRVYVFSNISDRISEDQLRRHCRGRKETEDYLVTLTERAFRKKRREIAEKAHFQTFAREAMLQAIDSAWVEQTDFLSQLSSAVSGRAFAQRNLLDEYQKEAYAAYGEMTAKAQTDIMRNLLLGWTEQGEDGALRVILP